MEDSPRSKGEEAKSESNVEDQQSETEQKSRSTQDFLERWRRFSSRDSERPPRETDDHEDKEDKEEEDDSSESLSSSSKKRFRRLRRRLKPFLPQTQEVVDSNLPDHAETSRQENPQHMSVEDILGSVTQEIEAQEERETERGGVEIVDSVSQDFASEGLAPDLEPEEVHNHTAAEEEDSYVGPEHDNELQVEVIPQVVPETESIEDILLRREHESEQARVALQRVGGSNRGDVGGTALVADTGRDSREKADHGAPVAGLLAVDVLNYKVAKRRDKHNRQLNEKQHEAIKKHHNTEQKKTNERLTTLETQRNNQYRSIDIKNRTPDRQIEVGKKEVIYNRYETEKKTEAVATPEQIHEPISRNERRQDEDPDKKVEQKSPESFENTLQRVAVAENGSISSEFQFERRHEVKDTPGDIKTGLGQNGLTVGSHTSSDIFRQEQRAVDMDTRLLDMSAKNASKEHKQPVYKQAAITGFWGAVVGITVFIIMYMLASR